MINTAILCLAPENVRLATKVYENPCLNDICIQVAWATMYAHPDKLDENHPQWANYIGYTEWLRNRICVHLEIPIDTQWEKLCQITGALIDKEYSSPEEAKKARKFGRNQRLHDKLAGPMFEIFESEIKLLIVNRD